jgi:heme exporter protein D
MQPSPRYSGLRHQVKVHSFRTITVVLAWVLIVAAFYQKPELLTGIQRAMQRGIETLGDSIPPPWGPRIEFVFREIGGFVWLQITLIVVALRVVLSGVATAWRSVRRRDAAL